MAVSLRELADLVGGEIVGQDLELDLLLTGLSGLHDAREGELAFFNNDRYLDALQTTRASAVLVQADIPAESMPEDGPVFVRVADASEAMAAVAREHFLDRREFRPGVHPGAHVDPGATLDPEKVAVGPGAIVEEGAVIGDGTDLRPGCFVGRKARLGADCVIHPNASIYHGCVLGDRVIIHSGAVVGSDGFGFLDRADERAKIEQVGIAELGDDVEVGAGSTIDRARIGRTILGSGTKLDNQVQIGHNAVVGSNCLFVSFVAIAGSARIGDYVTIAAFTGVAGHMKVGDRSVIGARTGVTKDLEGGQVYLGFPVQEAGKTRKLWAYTRKIPEINRRLKELEEKFAEKQG